MLESSTDPESYITEHTLLYEGKKKGEEGRTEGDEAEAEARRLLDVVEDRI